MPVLQLPVKIILWHGHSAYSGAPGAESNASAVQGQTPGSGGMLAHFMCGRNTRFCALMRRGKKETGKEGAYSCVVLGGARSMEERRRALQEWWRALQMHVAVRGGPGLCTSEYTCPFLSFKRSCDFAH
eukprot:1139138-Pelagomonas_calceolata.AAC.7